MALRGKAYKWQMENGEAFIFGRADWEYVLNTFCFGYTVGYKFVHTAPVNATATFLALARTIAIEPCSSSKARPMAS